MKKNQSAEILKKLRSLANAKNVAGMARFGINSKNTLGIPLPYLRDLAKKIGQNHQTAKDLWSSGVHEARILASLIADAKLISGKQMEEWVKDFDSWDVCDQVCLNLFDKTPLVFKKINQWTKASPEFVKRAGFALIASLAVHQRNLADEQFTKFFPLIKKGSTDDRNFVKKAVNWALRQIGKRNKKLNKEAIKLAQEIKKIDSRSARWIANNALLELKSEVVQQRLEKKLA